MDCYDYFWVGIFRSLFCGLVGEGTSGTPVLEKVSRDVFILGSP